MANATPVTAKPKKASSPKTASTPDVKSSAPSGERIRVGLPVDVKTEQVGGRECIVTKLDDDVTITRHIDVDPRFA